MNGKELFKLLGDLDENMVEDAWAEHDDEVIIIEQKSPMRFVKIAAAAAAGIAVLAGGFYGYTRLRNSVGYSPAASAVSDEESPSESEADLSIPSSEENSVESPVNTDSVSINGDVMWGMGKTFDELTERYGDITAGNFETYSFKNGYGKYSWSGGADPTQTDRDKNIEMIRGRGGCSIICDIPAKDFLIGDLSTVTLDNIAEKCGFEVIPLNPAPDGQTMYDGYKFALYTHPDYKNVSFSMMYNIENGFDDSATFRVSYDASAENPSESNADLSLPSSEESFTESNIKITDNFINTLNSVIDSAADVDALNSGIRNADADARVAAIQVFESPAAFQKNTILSAGKFENGMIVLVEFSDGKCYLTKRGERTNEAPPGYMFIDIIERADSIEQLATLIDAYNLVLGDRKVTSITLYDNGDDARDGNDSGIKIIENDKIVASNSVWKRGGYVRVAYDNEEAWGVLLKEYK